MVEEMKHGFLKAIEILSNIQRDDELLSEKMTSTKASQDRQLSDVVEMVLSLKVRPVEV